MEDNQMVCPFRIDTQMIYSGVMNKDETTEYLLAAQNEAYPDYIEGECPFYRYNNTCLRAEAMINEDDK